MGVSDFPPQILELLFKEPVHFRLCIFYFELSILILFKFHQVLQSFRFSLLHLHDHRVPSVWYFDHFKVADAVFHGGTLTPSCGQSAIVLQQLE